MKLISMRKNMLHVSTCVLFLLLTQRHASALTSETHYEDNSDYQRNYNIEDDSLNQSGSQSILRRQDNGFDFMSYFMGKKAQQQQQPVDQQQQPSQIQQQHLLQQQLLQQQQQRQQEQLQQLQQQQLNHLQQPHRIPADVGYQENTIQQHYQPQSAALNREGGYGGISVGNGYHQGYAQQPREIGFSIGGGKPIVQVGSILQLLPKIFNVLSGGGKVMFGVELGNNFYFGPVGAKPLG